MRLVSNLMILCGVLLAAACGPQAPATPLEEKKVVASAAAPAPTAGIPAAPSSEEEEHEDDLPTDEQGMYGFHGEIMPYPPPMGINGETTHFEPATNKATSYTGEVVFSGIPKAREPTQWLHMQAENGLAYDLEIVRGGGVDAIGKLDWSKIMTQPVEMQDYLSGNVDLPITVVFVYKVMREHVPRTAANGGLCKKTGYIAISVSHALDYITVAAFEKGPWPPKDASTHCGVFGYAMTEEDAGLQNGMRRLP